MGSSLFGVKGHQKVTRGHLVKITKLDLAMVKDHETLVDFGYVEDTIFNDL